MRKKVLLIHPSTNFNCINLPIGLFYLGSYLKKQNEVKSLEIINLPTQIGIPLNEKGLHEYKEKIKKLLEKKDFDIVGISCWTSILYQSSVLTANIIKEINKNAIIAVGGYHPSVLPEDFLYKDSPFDYIICGEGEFPFKNYVIEGMKQKTPKIIQNQDFLDLNFYENLEWNLLNELNLSTFNLGMLFLSRGCPYKCRFCLEKSNSSSKWRVVSPK
ncbi:MAG: B12-binding domain-containing radical SAM protein, partial [Candidatus Helarchaeota archaeon]